jgi:AtzE family amidohydrolase
MTHYAEMTAAEIAAGVRAGALSARDIVQAALSRIDRLNPELNAFTTVTRERALKKAAAVDAAVARGRDPGPLAGVPFAAKNLFDMTGIPTVAGSKINRDRAPAVADATLIARLEDSGAVLLGALNMGEYAYDFTGENAHDGPSRNPHAPDRMSGGSSGGSGTAAAAGMVPITLGSDTNGSIRVPSSLCGLFGLKPTYGRLSRAGTFPFVASLDHVGPMARSVRDLALALDAMSGPDAADPVLSEARFEPTAPLVGNGIDGLRIARAGGYFDRGGLAEAFAAVDAVAAQLGAKRTLGIDDARAARGAAYVITMTESASLHLERLRKHHADFDPDVRDRLLAGAMIPAAWIVKAQKVRRIFRERMLKIFEEVDVLLAPATPCSAPSIGQKTMTIDGVEMPVRPNLGIFTQPISFIGLPVVAVPVWLAGASLPIGVQVIAAPWREDVALRVARFLEASGVARAPVAKLGA